VAALDPNQQAADPLRTQWYYPEASRNGAAARKAGYPRTWYDTDPRFNVANACSTRDKGTTTCDEFPFFSTNQAVALSGTLASVKPVARSEQNPQRDDLSGFYRKCKVDGGDSFIVLPIKPWVEAGAPSFAFRINQGGADLCMSPQPPSTPGTN
jgi:hypothetical protein